MALKRLRPGDEDAPRTVSTTIMALLDRSDISMTEDAHQSTYVALIEILENVIRHSSSETTAFACAQVHPTTRKFSFCIADAGIGILQSFLSGPFLPLESASWLETTNCRWPWNRSSAASMDEAILV